MSDRYLNIALPKGRLGEKAYGLLAKAGYECPSVLEESRKLIFEDEGNKVRYFWVKPSDVAVYVERGSADMGIVGSDTILETEPSIYELLDLNIGKCTMSVAGPKGFTDDRSRVLRVATKYPNITRDYYDGLGRDIDVIKLNGSIELAPILALSDVIVDIVETGNTLRENGLIKYTDIMDISARLIANKVSYKFLYGRMTELMKALENVVKEEALKA